MVWPFGGYPSSKKKRSEMKPPTKDKRYGGYSADVYSGDLKPPVGLRQPAPVLGSKANIRCTEHPTCINYDGHEGPHSIPKKKDAMKVFAVYYDEDTIGYKLKFYEVPKDFEENPRGIIPIEMLFKSIIVVTEDGRILKNRFGSTTPEPKPVVQTTCPSPYCELPAEHEGAHYQSRPRPRRPLSELSLTELCLLHEAYSNEDTRFDIKREINQRWSYK